MPDAGDDNLPTTDGDPLTTSIQIDVTGHYPDTSSDVTFVQVKNSDYFNRITQVTAFDAADAGTPFIYLVAGTYSDKYSWDSKNQNAEYPFAFGRELRCDLAQDGEKANYTATVTAASDGSKDVLWMPPGLTVGTARDKPHAVGGKIDVAVTGTGADGRDFGYGYAPQLMDLSFSLKAFWIAWPMPTLQTT